MVFFPEDLKRQQDSAKRPAPLPPPAAPSDVVECPTEVKNILAPDEKILATMRQSRMKSLMAPDTIVVTSERILLCKPSAFGLKKQIEDFRYQDMANFRVDKGLSCGSIIIKQNFMSNDIVISDLPKAPLDNITRIIQDKIRSARSGSSAPVQSAASSQEPLTLLKTRFAKGEITRAEFEEMKQILGT